MKVIGIIAEYNPFHNGHAYQIKKIKDDLQADYIVVAMSGDFVQRGAPAMIDKYARTQMALSCGADLVIELPVLWATASAEAFAMAGVTLFDKMGCVDGICFGAETDDLALLSEIAGILAVEPEAYRALLSSYLKEGLAFPVARSKALCEYLAQSVASVDESRHFVDEVDLDKISSILDEPNNILAIEYLKALKRRDSSMTPHVIKREGAGYHDEDITVPTASATAIRRTLDAVSVNTCQGTANTLSGDSTHIESLASAMPAPALEVLKEYIGASSLIRSNDFSSILGYKILTSDVCALTDIGDSNSDIANRILKKRMNFSSFEQFCELNKSKDVTYTRISRVLMHLILNINKQDYQLGKDVDYVPYLRILGFCKDSTALLKKLKNAANVPIISKLADAASLLDANAMSLLEKDIFAADLYSQILAHKTGTISQSEYTRNIVRK
ncbi:MAG: nucleotidyltransferase [Roseburia sp.]|nr:nucleotidyltransferase [Roseburia sp.]